MTKLTRAAAEFQDDNSGQLSLTEKQSKLSLVAGARLGSNFNSDKADLVLEIRNMGNRREVVVHNERRAAYAILILIE